MARSATVREQLEDTESALEQACAELRRAKKALKTMKERAETLEKGLLEAKEGREVEQDVLVQMQDACQAAHERHLLDREILRGLAELAGLEECVDRSLRVAALLSRLPASNEEP